MYETREVVRDRYVKVPDSLTRPVAVPPLSADFDVYELGAVARQRGIRLEQCNNQLLEIGSLPATPEPP